MQLMGYAVRIPPSDRIATRGWPTGTVEMKDVFIQVCLEVHSKSCALQVLQAIPGSFMRLELCGAGSTASTATAAIQVVLEVPPEPYRIGHVTHARDGFADDIVQAHAQQGGALLDDLAVDASGKAPVLVLLLDGLELEVQDAL